MDESASNAVEESIKHSIRKNGFPEKIVRLPFKPVYDACKKNGTPLAGVLDKLQKQQIFSKIIGNHLEFRSQEKIDFKLPSEESSAESPSSSNKDAANNPKELQETAREAVGNMTPEQIAEILKMTENMSDEEKMNMLKMFTQRFDSGK